MQRDGAGWQVLPGLCQAYPSRRMREQHTRKGQAVSHIHLKSLSGAPLLLSLRAGPRHLSAARPRASSRQDCGERRGRVEMGGARGSPAPGRLRLRQRRLAPIPADGRGKGHGALHSRLGSKLASLTPNSNSLGKRRDRIAIFTLDPGGF